MIGNGHHGLSPNAPTVETVAIVTGGSSPTGRELAVGLATWGWAIVLVYLDDQPSADAALAEILAADGRTVAVRADLADDLDVERLFAESIAAFGGVDAVVHTTTESPYLLHEYAARHVRERGVIVTVCAPELIAPGAARRAWEHGITVGRAPPEAVLAFLENWHRQAIG